MKLILRIFSALFVFSFLSFISACDDSSEPAPIEDPNPVEEEPEPYFYIKTGANTNRIQWIVITNGLGEIVGYKEIDSVNAEETVMSERLAEIDGNINVYHIYITENAFAEPKTSYYITAYLDQELGKHWSFGGSGGSSDYEEIDINIYNLPDPFLPQMSAGGSYDFEKIDTDVDGVNDTVKFQYGLSPPESEYILGIHNPTSSKYVVVESQTSFQEFTYPDDFHSYDHEIDVPISDPDQVTVFGVRNNQSSVFLLITKMLDEPGWVHSSIKFPYLDGYDYYYTYYQIGLNTYSKTGSIPTAEDIVIPDRVITVTNSSLFDFEATYPAEIDYRRSIYSFTENEGATDGDYIDVNVFALKDAGTSFDLTLPDEFIDAHRDINFSLLEYKSSEFADVKTGDLNKLWLKPPADGVVELEEYKYIVPK